MIIPFVFSSSTTVSTATIAPRAVRYFFGSNNVRPTTTAIVRRLSTMQDVIARPERPRRSLFSVPGADGRKIAKAQTLGADAIVLDLEDGVALDQKETARALVRETLLSDGANFGNSELCVRINGLVTKELAVQDLQAVLGCEHLQAVVIPKVETSADVHFVDRMMDAYGGGHCRDLRIIAAIESAEGMLNIRDIATTASSSRLDALVFASEDYCADLEMIRTPTAIELLYPRSKLVTTAKAHNLQAIDMVHIQFQDLEGLAEECLRGRALGFTGKQAIHPIQIPTIQEAFSPSLKDVNFAIRVVDTYEMTTASGKGACVVDGIVVDTPVYKWARKILKRAKIENIR